MNRLEILHRRAEALARPQIDPAGAKPQLHTVQFRLGDERYAIEASFVREVLKPREIWPLPCVPAFIAGLINVRGQLVSVVDLGELFQLPDGDSEVDTSVVLISSELMEFGLLVEELFGVHSIPLDEIQTDVPALPGIRPEYLRGLTGEGTIVLCAAAMLSDQRLVIQDAGV